VKIHKDLLALWVTYCKQQAKRKADKQSFLAAFEISNIEADFENIGEIFTEKKENNE
jgi:ABC-type phosphate transport system ATPase subunit